MLKGALIFLVIGLVAALLGFTTIAGASFAIAKVLAGLFLFIFLTSFMTNTQSLTSNYWPTTWHPENYITVFRKTEMPQYLWNTVIYAGLGTVFTILSSVPAAYALAKLQWRGRKFVFLIVICMMLLPPQITTVPLYSMWASYGLTGTLWPLILPTLFGDAFSIFLLRQFMLTIPNEYLDAARVDGCGEWRTLLRVVLPMARPGIAAAGLFMFFNSWNDYYGPLLYTSENEQWWPVSYGLATFRGSHSTNWGLTMAITVLVMVPVVLIFFFAQRVFVEGITLTGVKG